MFKNKHRTQNTLSFISSLTIQQYYNFLLVVLGKTRVATPIYFVFNYNNKLMIEMLTYMYF